MVALGVVQQPPRPALAQWSDKVPLLEAQACWTLDAGKVG
jgi:hypothetical protein